MSGEGHAIPFHCPYCADENLRPHGEAHGEWECRSCLRAFKLSFKGLLAPAAVAPSDSDSETDVGSSNMAATEGGPA